MIKEKLTFYSVLLFFYAFVPAPFGQMATDTIKGNYDFRAVRWGMPVDQVKAAERNTKFLGESRGMLLYQIVMDGLPATLSYEIRDKKAVSGEYMVSFSNSKISLEKQQQRFNEMVTMMTFKYGTPLEKSSSGQGEMKTAEDYSWETPETLISLTRFGEVIYVTYKASAGK
jgi:hypothetical protein